MGPGPSDCSLQGAGSTNIVIAAKLFDGFVTDYIAVGKVYDAQQFIDLVVKQGAAPVIQPKKNRRVQREYDKCLYKDRRLVEFFFYTLKNFSPVATYYAKLAGIFLTMFAIALCLIWLRRVEDRPYMFVTKYIVCCTMSHTDSIATNFADATLGRPTLRRRLATKARLNGYGREKKQP